MRVLYVVVSTSELVSFVKGVEMKKIMAFFIVTLSCLISSCATTLLYSKDINNKPFLEEVNSFLISTDQKQLIIIGNKHHYIFPLEQNLKEILAWNVHKKLTASHLEFIISRSDIINGDFRLEPISGMHLSQDDVVFLSDHQFRRTSNSPEAAYQYRGRLSKGRVYDAGEFQLPNGVAFKHPYQFYISYDYPPLGKFMARTLLTPVTVAYRASRASIGGVYRLRYTGLWSALI